MKRGRIIGKVPCLDLGIKQLRRAGEGGEAARRKEKDKTLLELQSFFFAQGTKLASVLYLCSLITSFQARKPWQQKGSW